MKLLRSLLILVVGFVCLVLKAEPIVITSDASGLIVETVDSVQGNQEGMVLTREVALPEFERGVYYRPFSGGVARGNRVEAVAFDSIAELNEAASRHLE